MSEFLYAILGQLVTSGALYGMSVIKPELLFNWLTPKIVKFLGKDNANKVTNRLQIKLIDLVSDTLSTIPDDEDVGKITEELKDIKTRLEKQLTDFEKK